MEDEQSELDAAIKSSRNAYFAHRAYMQPTPAFLRLFSDAFQLGADYAMDAAPQPNAAPLEAAVRKLHAAKGRYHTQLACCDLYDLLGLPNVRPGHDAAPPTINAKDQS